MSWKNSALVGGPLLLLLGAALAWAFTGCVGCEDGICPDDPEDCCSGRCVVEYRGNPTASSYCAQDD